MSKIKSARKLIEDREQLKGIKSKEQKLWVCVVLQAILDTRSGNPNTRADAMLFLTGQTRALFWIARAAKLDAETIMSLCKSGR